MDSTQEIKKKSGKWIIITVICLLIAGTLFMFTPQIKYFVATTKLSHGLYEEAALAFENLGDFKDSDSKVLESRYAWACSLQENFEYDKAAEIFSDLKEYSDAKSKLTECEYNHACALTEKGDFASALKIFGGLKDYSDSEDKLIFCKYNMACESMETGNYSQALTYFQEIPSYQDSDQKIIEVTYLLGKESLDSGDYGVAVDYLERISELKEVSDELAIARYNFAIACYDKGDLSKAKELFAQVGRYEDATDYLKKIRYYEPLQGTYTSKFGNRKSFVICGDTIYTIYRIESGSFTKDGTYVYERKFEVGQTKFNLFESDFRLKNGVFYEADSFLGTVIWKKSSKSTSVPKSDTFGYKEDPAIGMTAAEVRESTWGKPQKINKTTTQYGVFEQWCYSNYRYIYLDNGIVSSIQE